MTTRFPMCQLTTGPSDDATVLFDCSDSSTPGVETRPLSQGWSIGRPELQGDVDALGVQWGPRKVTFTVRVTGARTAARAVQSRLARVLIQRRCWVRFQLDANTAPVWWHAYRSQPGDLDFSQVFVDGNGDYVTADSLADDVIPRPDTWRIDVTLDAKPWGALARETLGPILIGNDPTDPDPQAYYAALPPVLGDAPTYARVGITPDKVSDPSEGGRWLTMVVHGDPVAPTLLPVGTSDGWTDPFGAGLGAPVTGSPAAAYVGGSYRPVTLTTPTFACRMQHVISVLPGVYRVFLRAQLVDATGPCRATFAASREPVRAPTSPTFIRVPATNINVVDDTMHIIDMGTIVAGPQDLPADVTPTVSDVFLRLWMGSDSSDLVVRADQVILVRISENTAQITNDTLTARFVTAPDSTTYLDGDDETSWREDDGDILSAPLADPQGGFVTLDPATSNTLYVMALESGGQVPTTASMQSIASKTAVHTVTVSYSPQVTWLPGAASDDDIEGTP